MPKLDLQSWQTRQTPGAIVLEWQAPHKSLPQQVVILEEASLWRGAEHRAQAIGSSLVFTMPLSGWGLAVVIFGGLQVGSDTDENYFDRSSL